MAGRAVRVDGETGAAVEPDPFAADHDSPVRLQRDARLVEHLRALGFAGPLYEQFETELMNYAIDVLSGWMCTGKIFAVLVEKHGFGLSPTEDELHALHHDPEARGDIAVMTAASALGKFRTRALREGGWDPARGASVATYFVGACLYEFPDEFRSFQDERDRHTSVLVALGREPAPAPNPGTDPEHAILGQMHVREELAAIREGTTRACVALMLDGAKHEEIAESVPGIDSPRAAEGRLYRWKRIRRKEAEA